MRAFTPLALLLFTCAASPAAAPEEPSAGAVMVVAPESALSFEPAAPGERTEAALDGGLLTPASRLAAPRGGDHWLAVVSRDAVGNVSATRWIRLRVDGEPPRVSLAVTPSPVPDEKGRAWVPGGARVAGRAEDGLAGLARVWLETGGRKVEGDGETPLVLALGDDGASSAGAVDRVGNRSEDARLALSVDAVPPTGRIRAEGPQVSAAAGLVVGPGARLQLEREDAGSGVASWAGFVDGRYAGPEVWPGPWPPGPHEATAEIVDRVGNRARVAPLVFEVDAAAPEITWAVEDEGVPDADGHRVYRPPLSVRVAAQDASAGVGELGWAEVGGGWQPVRDRLTTATDRIRIRARDRVGNEAETTASWRLDLEPPRILVDGEELAAAPRVTLERPVGGGFRISARDGGAGVRRVELSLDGGAWGPSPDVIVFATPGQRHLAVKAVDRLGNLRQVEWDARVRRAPR